MELATSVQLTHTRVPESSSKTLLGLFLVYLVVFLRRWNADTINNRAQAADHILTGPETCFGSQLTTSLDHSHNGTFRHAVFSPSSSQLLLRVMAKKIQARKMNSVGWRQSEY